ncbi:lytic polysaccharide monooxygenase [Pseudomonas sp. BJa5]|uniref:lytic polysaccharide monooxygenase n=1 Tax=Pseudomonas sp. BJa5 TaxID=2936270 RepID=UPI002559619D|nr:lytic polysaccharide monooxygenase [Pseudomonas sp. BGr12]MDL2424106.1 lytic polysaccharide monooxygenase [Pseudomonas sp. BGr12]
MSEQRANVISRSITPRHGHIFSPASRAYFAWQAGEIDEGALNQRESGKFFPHTAGGQTDPYARDDVANAAPPPDGKIASANQSTGQHLDQPGSHWRKHEVRGGETLDISWTFTANHVTRRWNYFITRQGWDPSRVLSRDQFEAQPFYQVQINLQPYWSHSNSMKPPSPTVHEVPLPQRDGYHVLLAVWEVADTANAFYQVVDLDFVPSEGGGQRPDAPTGLRAGNVTDRQVVLTWNAATGPHPIARYRLSRNGTTSVDVQAPQLTWTDQSVAADTLYSYFITAVDNQGNESPPSRAIEVRTPGQDGAPTPPTNLHSMGVSAQSVSLMWGASTGTAPIAQYLLFRDGIEVQRLSGDRTAFEDSGLRPATQYQYVVRALDTQGRLSLPGNVLSVRTANGEGQYPAWRLNTPYATNALVSHAGGNWRCLQAHTSYTEDWAPGKPSSEVLWVVHP